MQPALGDPAWAGVGLGDPQRALPTPTILCDSVTGGQTYWFDCDFVPCIPKKEGAVGRGPRARVFSPLGLFIAVTVKVCVSPLCSEVVAEATPRTRLVRALRFRVVEPLYPTAKSIKGKILKITRPQLLKEGDSAVAA